LLFVEREDDDGKHESGVAGFFTGF
jgi:hypothetical protein